MKKGEIDFRRMYEEARDFLIIKLGNKCPKDTTPEKECMGGNKCPLVRNTEFCYDRYFLRRVIKREEAEE